MQTNIQKTDTSKSPLLTPVIERNYTQGLGGGLSGNSDKQPSGHVNTEKTEPQTGPGSNPNFQPPPPGSSNAGPGHSGNDETKSFSFDEETEAGSDLKDGEQGPGVTMPTGSARTFANFVGNAIQIYLPKATYGYVKIDIDDVIMNVEKGNLLHKWVDVFENMNKSAEEGLKIPDENIKMWKAAFQHWLEYKQVELANPTTELVAATILLLGDQAVRAYSIKKQMAKYFKDAIEDSNPGLFDQKKKNAEEDKTLKPQKDVASAA
jgi:hypothetical protein